ncbi:MAG: TerB family tellurite resistance protein [Ramlibacter sp.]|nr:TerB family tellurite resistance protein [Ramlibacter sp.]
MLSSLKEFLDSFTGPSEAQSAQEAERAVRLAAAVLLVEVMRADPANTPAERAAVVAGLRERFSFADDEVARLVDLAQAEAEHANDYYRFTSLLNERFSQPQKIALVEAMWQVAYADAHLDANENHVISKLAELLHVTHGEYIGAKMRAKEAAGLV